MRIVAALVLVLALAPALRAQEAIDLDADGVGEALDACPDTPLGDLVGPDGCSLCPCEGPADVDRPWVARFEYFRCVVAAARAKREDGLSRRAYRDALRHARLASCGDPVKTRCCFYRDENDDQGSCRIVDADRCDADLMHTYDAEDMDPGSCLPSPCVFE